MTTYILTTIKLNYVVCPVKIRPISVDSVQPSYGPAAGGTRVTIIGQFLTCPLPPLFTSVNTKASLTSTGELLICVFSVGLVLKRLFFSSCYCCFSRSGTLYAYTLERLSLIEIFLTLNLACSWGLSRPIIRSH